MVQQKILVAGDSMIDRYWEGSVDRISPEAPVPVLRLGQEWHRAGGAANVAVNLAAMGSPTALATLLGHDEAGARLAALLQAAGVQLYATRAAGVTTTEKIRAVCNRQQLLRIDIENPPPAPAVHDFCQQVQQLLPQHPWVMFSDYRKGALSHCGAMIAQAHQRGCKVLIDPKGQDFEQYRGAWLLKPNEKEAAAIVGSWSGEQEFSRTMAAFRARLELQHLLVTRGERGMSLFSADRAPLHVPTAAREVFDVSGAGDTVLAALTSFLAAGETLEDAVQHANLAAGVAVAKFGTAVVTRDDIQQAQTGRGGR